MKNRIIKICGLTDPENIRKILAINPDWIGLIFYPGSRRFIMDPEKLIPIVSERGKTQIAGVFVNTGIDEILLIHRILHLNGIQLHGHESPDVCQDLKRHKLKIIKAFSIHPTFEFDQLKPYVPVVDYLLFDTPGAGFGGTGRAFNWQVLDHYHEKRPFILSGGIGPDSGHFPDHPQWAGIDLNSRFESEPGIKKTGELKTFMINFKKRYEPLPR